MENLKWTKEYSVGVKQFDEQHEKLFSYLTELHEAFDKHNNNKEIASKTLNDLIVYMFYHFTSEEFYMKKYSYPELSLHVSEHNKLREKVFKYQESLNSGKKVIQLKELTDFLTDWIKEHILKTDKNYQSFFKKLGVT